MRQQHDNGSSQDQSSRDGQQQEQRSQNNLSFKSDHELGGIALQAATIENFLLPDPAPNQMTLLYSEPIDLGHQDSNGQTLLHQAARVGSTAVVRELLDSEDKYRTDLGRTLEFLTPLVEVFEDNAHEYRTVQTEKAIALGEVGASVQGWAWFRNVGTDTTTAVRIGLDVSGNFFPVFELKGGEFAIMRLANQQLHAKSTSGNLFLQFNIIEE